MAETGSVGNQSDLDHIRHYHGDGVGGATSKAFPWYLVIIGILVIAGFAVLFLLTKKTRRNGGRRQLRRANCKPGTLCDDEDKNKMAQPSSALPSVLSRSAFRTFSESSSLASEPVSMNRTPSGGLDSLGE
ncbi:hypothetical protein HDE_04290 [Halotydeus destructor]|nr:hypothetical protein HDE_04290 [Halotydeus destructor]